MFEESRLKRDLENAESYEEWREAARAYDKYHGHDRWRSRDATSRFDYAVIRYRLDELRALRSAQDTAGLLYALNEGIHGNLGGMGNARLYKRALSGTKNLIEEFIEETADALDLILVDDSGDISIQEKIDFFERASQCYGRTALMLSASGSLYPFHLGVARALLNEDLMPSVLSGSSGGSVAGGVLCCHSDEELETVLNPDYIIDQITDADRESNRTTDESLREYLLRIVPDLTFQQALEKSGRSMNVTIAPAETHQTSRLLNDTTSPAVLMHSAIRASCAVPGFFSPVGLEALGKDGKRKKYLPSRVWVDGAVSDNLPAKRLARMYGVNHFIVSQVSPHIIPFVAEGQKKQTLPNVIWDAGRASARAWFNVMTHITEATPFMPQSIRKANSIARSMINQDHFGDINIVADLRGVNLLKLLGHQDDKQIRRLFEMGQKYTWPKLEMIRLQTLLSRKLDGILADLESQWPARDAANG